MTRDSSMMGRNALGPFEQQSTGRRMADITQTEDANHPLALVDHEQPADLQLLHVLHRLGKVIVITAAMDAGVMARHRAMLNRPAGSARTPEA